jgi:phosphotransferase family enzyme
MTQDHNTAGKTGPDSQGSAEGGGVSYPVDNPTVHRAAGIPGELAAGSFGTMLEPVLRSVCEGRLSQVGWFRTDWQRGGAVTGYATYRDDDGVDRPVVVKMPVPPCELQWMSALQRFDDVVPTVFASGGVLGGYDMAWLVMERLAFGPLGSAWEGREFDLLIESIGRFYQAAGEFPTHKDHYESRDWDGIYEHARRSVRDHALPEGQRWGKALKKAHRKYKEWVTVWNDRPMEHWCHGDLHLGNAMTRRQPPEGPAVLFDLAKICVSHWVQDGVYLEHLYWGRPGDLGGHKLCKELAHHRKKIGLPVDAGWADLAQAKRALLAMSVPAKLDLDGNADYVHGALQVLENAVV